MWQLDSNMPLVECRGLEAEGNNIVLLRLTVGRSSTFREFSIILLLVDTPKTLKNEVQETESTLVQQCL